MGLLAKVGALVAAMGNSQPLTVGPMGGLRAHDAHARFMDAVYAGRIYEVALAAGSVAGYTGGAGGTPALGLYNPPNSKRHASLVAIAYGVSAAASAAGQTVLRAYGGPSVQPTGQNYTPRNALSGNQSGSAMQGWSNAAMTGASALTYIATLASYYWATAASAFLQSGLIFCEGLVHAAPGCAIGIGLPANLTGANHDVAMFFEELPDVSYT